MKTSEKIAVLDKVFDAAVGATQLTNNEVSDWLKKRQESFAGINFFPSNKSFVKSVFPVSYFEETPNGILLPRTKMEKIPIVTLEDLRLDWVSKVAGYMLLPDTFLAKKCGADGNVESATWDNSKAFAEKMSLNGKKCSLPSKNVFKKHWSEELRNKIQAMDKFLLKEGVDAEQKYYGIPWCCEVYVDNYAYYFDLDLGLDNCSDKSHTGSSDRLAVAFI